MSSRMSQWMRRRRNQCSAPNVLARPVVDHDGRGPSGGVARDRGKPMAEAVPPEVRAAQRRVISTVRVSGLLNGDGLALWREVGCEEWKTTAAEIGRDMDLLEVPYTIVSAAASSGQFA